MDVYECLCNVYGHEYFPVKWRFRIFYLKLKMKKDIPVTHKGIDVPEF